jgi:hypothetical protein
MAPHTTNPLQCNPLIESGHNVRNNLPNILPWMTEKLSQLNSEHEVCDKRHKKIPKPKCNASNK